ncbi:MAG: hypothetical protein U0136_14340 [Bdellovibrionota bacterium]
MTIPVAAARGSISAWKRWSTALLCGVFVAAGGCNGGSGGIASGTNGGGATGGDVTGGTGGGAGPITPGAGGGGGGTGSPTGGSDTPGGDTPSTPPGSGGGGGTVTATLDPGSTSDTTVRTSANISNVTASDGIGGVPVALKNVNAVQFVTQATNFDIAAQLTDPANRAVVAYRPPATAPQQTTGVFLNTHVNTLPYPTSNQDTPITNGIYTEGLIVDPATSTGYTTTVTVKNDPNLSQGLLRVNLFLVGTEAQKSENRDALDKAVTVWRAIYGQAGIVLDVQTADVASGTGVLPNPVAGSDFYKSQAQASRSNAVNIYLGQAISNTGGTNPGNDTGALLGVASAVPGPNIPTVTSAVAIDLVQHAGTDGVFSDAEVEVLGETLAHEAGHYLGLSHPVEFADMSHATFVEGDLLPDTATCTSEAQCLANGIVKNVMFPSPVAGIPQQRDVTGQQGATLNLQVMVD